jgi:hypothetical protein
LTANKSIATVWGALTVRCALKNLEAFRFSNLLFDVGDGRSLANGGRALRVDVPISLRMGRMGPWGGFFIAMEATRGAKVRATVYVKPAVASTYVCDNCNA